MRQLKRKVTQLYDEAEVRADSWLYKLMKSRWTVFFLLGMALGGIVLLFT